jgi:hypothetical protein
MRKRNIKFGAEERMTIFILNKNQQNIIYYPSTKSLKTPIFL